MKTSATNPRMKAPLKPPNSICFLVAPCAKPHLVLRLAFCTNSSLTFCQTGRCLVGNYLLVGDRLALDRLDARAREDSDQNMEACRVGLSLQFYLDLHVAGLLFVE